MSPKSKRPRMDLTRTLALVAALSWVAADAAWADPGRAGASRSGSRSGKSISASKGSATSTASSGSSSRSVVRRSSKTSNRASGRSRARVRGGTGAARTRTSSALDHRRDGHHGSSRGYFGRSYYSYLFSGHWGYWGFWGGNLGFGYGPGYGYGYYPPVVYSSHQGYRMGALDLNVRPKTTEIYVDGQYVGLARKYDGFPGHLWLDRGVYEISFFKPGFETQTRTVKILTNLVLDMQIAMNAGEATKPEMRFLPGEREEDDGEDEVAQRRQRGVLHGRLHLEVDPGNAVVYLDGNVLGTGDELAALHAGLILSPGTHALEVVRRGFETLERRLVVEPGRELELVLTLKPVERASI